MFCEVVPTADGTVVPRFRFLGIQPVIAQDGWGEIYVTHDGVTTKFRDVVLLPSKAIAWDWKWSEDGGMDHAPGLRKKDLDHYVLAGDPIPRIVILSTGRDNALLVDPSLKKYILQRGVEMVFVLQTDEAIAKYKELCAQGLSVAALIHTTC
jgi:hypothetical protein